MLANLKVPGVYTQEISVLPPSVAAVPTAVPAFLGYTQLTQDADGQSLINVAVKIQSQKEFEALFGFGPELRLTEVFLDAQLRFLRSDVQLDFYLYDAIRLFYANGGGECYIVSVGGYSYDPGGGPEIVPANFTDAGTGLDVISRVDEPTLLLFPDAAAMDNAGLIAVQQAALAQCGDLKDRFTVCDLTEGDTIQRVGFAPGQDFRDAIGVNNLKYGATYTPWLQCSLQHPIDFSLLQSITLNFADGSTLVGFDHTTLHDDNPDILPLMLVNTVITAHNEIQAGPQPVDTTAFTAALDASEADPPVVPLPVEIPPLRVALDAAITNYDADDTLTDELATAFADYQAAIFSAYDLENNLRSLFPLYGTVANGVENAVTHHPPSGAVVGVYARVDAARGVWKAPANESLNSVLGPTARFTQSELANLNVSTNGKSINAIRAFTGKGTLIFGARTLAGNSGDDRYVNVRRLLIFLEESIEKAVEAFVFEPNDANTWRRVQGMIENFLNLQWRAGALQGARPEDAYRVAVGLGRTMTADDVINGRMIVDISLAPVRPAEFIILRFSQQQAQS
ncbi:phage tail sheath family protein [Neolewinella persica]|uniref:phage tail sheath family protein n=1 Tax=Neolewinella persica TaxID=70998 RepID=UPI0003698D52|nr:phage tail sheath C-terminal domain-containing protein [Neolewinella persica]